MSEHQHTIRTVSKLTGLSQHVIRIWEKRYGAVRPNRSETKRRLYSEDEVERLNILGRATAAGFAIGTIATLPTESIRQLLAQQEQTAPAQPSGTMDEQVMEEAVRAVMRMDEERLDQALSRAAIALGTHGLLQKVVGPLAEKIGVLWRDGTISAAHEHFLTAAVRTYVGKSVRPYLLNASAPVLVVGTPSNQVHELGAIIVAAAASDLGWRVVYLGTSLPAAEIAGAVVQNKVRAVALSIVYPEDDPNLAEELVTLRKFLPGKVDILAGGRAARGYESTLKQIGALQPKDLTELNETLDRLRERHEG